MYLLRLTSLVVCRGRHNDKGTELVNLILSKFEPGRRHSIYYENIHFIRALRFIFYFNIILPRKFLQENKDSNAFLDILFHQTSYKSKN